MRKENVIVAFAVLICLLLMSIQSSFADGTVSAESFTGLFLMAAPAANFPPQFYLAFIDMTEAHVTLSSEMYTFEMTVASTPPDWVTSDWHPTLAPGKHEIPIWGVGYGLWLWDASGTFLGLLRVAWIMGALDPSVQIVDVPFKAFYVGGVGIQYPPLPSSLNFVFDQANNRMTMTIAQSDFSSLFPTATQWRATTRAAVGLVAPGIFIQEHSNLADLPS